LVVNASNFAFPENTNIMLIDQNQYQEIVKDLDQKNVKLVAVSKTKPVQAIQELYNLGHRDFGENYVQELVEKQVQLPADIRWHFIGHLQTNKVKYIAPFVHLVHGVDSWKLLTEINKQAAKQNRVIDLLLQIHIAQEETKFGLDENEIKDIIASLADVPQHNIRVRGLMGMASFTENISQIKEEFKYLKLLFDKYKELRTSNIQMDTLSMGMSSDYKIAVEEGSNMVRVGSLIFGERTYNK